LKKPEKPVKTNRKGDEYIRNCQTEMRLQMESRNIRIRRLLRRIPMALSIEMRQLLRQKPLEMKTWTLDLDEQ
jgi:hypothetical protein